MEQPKRPALASPAGLAFLWDYMIAQSHARPRESGATGDALRFVAHCLGGYDQSYAQLFQDLYVTYRLPGLKSGFFVEFGAMDGVTLSNTCHLERALGWTGILAEPFPQWHAAMEAARHARIDKRCVWWESGKALDFVASRTNPELSTLAEFVDSDYNASARTDCETLTVESVSLNDLLLQHNAPQTIDYLSIDTEGSELDILSAFDFKSYNVRVITVEHNYRDDVRGLLHQLLTAHGFVRELEIFSRFDDWYYHPARV